MDRPVSHGATRGADFGARRVSAVLAGQPTVAGMDDEYLPAISVEYQPSLGSILLRWLRASERAREFVLYGAAAIS